jgi:LysM repeat protein
MLTRRVLRPLPLMPATREIERDHSLARIGLFLCFCVSAVAFSMAVAKLPVKNLASVPQLQFLSSFIAGATAPAASTSPSPLTAPSAIVLASPASTPASLPPAVGASVQVVAPAPITAPSVAASPEAGAAALASSPARPAPQSAQPAASVAAGPASPSPKPASPSPSKAAATARASYTVEAGDTLFAIARKYGVTTQALADANGLSASGAIRAGQKLAIPG